MSSDTLDKTLTDIAEAARELGTLGANPYLSSDANGEAMLDFSERILDLVRQEIPNV